jgi:two-component system response regulator AtoC
VISDPSQAKKKPGSARGAPRYFHLLWDEDLEELREVLEAILNRRSEVVRRWYQLYVLHFGDARSLSEAEFYAIFESAIERNKSALLEGDMGKYASEMIRLGEILAERRIPIEEVIASLHLFEESAHTVFPNNPLLPIRIYTMFDKLSHVRIILMVAAYFRSTSAVSGRRIAMLERDAAQLPQECRTTFSGLVGASPAMLELYRRIAAASATRGNVLIVGESGTGKELIARALHESGGRSEQPFVAFNCAAIPKDLIESEMFGYKRGAFSGANIDHLGLFRAADGGTVFLDEVTEMSLETQSKLLRTLQEQAVRPLGATREQPIDVRLIASTNREPEEAVARGQLRSDLYYRLQASVLRVPPLRERREDIPLLVEHFIALFNQRLGRSIAGIDELALEAMLEHGWPGNVRELSNAIEGAITFTQNQTIARDDLPSTISRIATPPKAAGRPVVSQKNLASLADVERDLIRRALESTAGNKVATAKLLDISRKKLYAKIRKYNLK